MNIETVITITHFSVSVKQLIGFLRACIWLPADLLLDSRHLFSTLATQLLEYLTSRGLGFGQPVPLHHACCPTSRVFGFPRACFWAAVPSLPRMLPNTSSNKHPANKIWGSRPPLRRVCSPFLYSISIPRACFWSSGTSSPLLLPNFSSILLPANLLLGS